LINRPAVAGLVADLLQLGELPELGRWQEPDLSGSSFYLRRNVALYFYGERFEKVVGWRQ